MSSTLSCKNNRTHSVSKQKNKCVCIHEIMRLTIMRMKMKMKNKSHRYGINRLSFKHGQKSSTYTNCRVMMTLICIKQHQSNIWNSIHEKIKQHWGWVEKSVAYKKKKCVSIIILRHFLYFPYLCSYLGLDLFMLYLCHIFFILIFIFIMINRVTAWIQAHLFFCLFF